MKLITGTEQELFNLEAEMFIFGAPFSAYLAGDIWSEENKCVYGHRAGKVNTSAGTTAWQSLIDLGNDLKAIVHIDEFTFQPHTLQNYYDMLPVLPEEYPEGETEADYLNSNELAIKQRIEAIAPELWELTPQQYVSQEIIGSTYTIIEN